MEPCRLSATQALKRLKNGDLTVETYAQSLLSRIAERDSKVKAWAYLDTEFVLAQARKLDEMPPDKRGLLHGLPVGVKDVMLTKGKISIRLYSLISAIFRL